MYSPESASDSASFLSSGYASDSVCAPFDDESSSLATSVPGSTNGSTEALTQMDLSAYERCAQDLETHHEESLENARKMPERIEAIRESFKAVRGYWKNLQADFDKETISRYYARWGELDKTFEGIVLETNRLASKGARRIKDFATDFCNFIGNNDGTATIGEKIRELKRFQNDLFSEQTSLFGPQSKHLYELTNKINGLHRDVQSFGYEIATCDFPGKQEAIKEIESLEKELRQLKFKVFDKRNSDGNGQRTGLWSGVAAVLSLFGGDREALDNSVEASLARHNQEHEKKANTQQIKDEIAKKKSDMKMRDEVWGKHTRDCGEQINQITDQLLAISSLWTALCSDTVELDTQLGLIAKKDMHENLFYRKLATTQRLYSRLYEILRELTHAKSSDSYSASSMAHVRTTTQRSPETRSEPQSNPGVPSTILRHDIIGNPLVRQRSPEPLSRTSTCHSNDVHPYASEPTNGAGPKRIRKRDKLYGKLKEIKTAIMTH